MDELDLAADGKCHLKSRRKGAQDFDIGKDEAARVLDLAKTAFDAKPPAPGGPRIGGADYMTYVVRYDNNEKTYNDLNAPDEFKALTRALTGIIAKHAKQTR